MRILFVCMGNICRSPTAEAATREALAAAGLDGRVELDSAGTGSWHVGSPPDARMTAAAAREGLRLDGRARQFGPDDFDRFDLVCVMDRTNLHEVVAQARYDDDREKVCLFREFDPDARGFDDHEVPDPYYGGEEGFRTVVAMARRAAAGLTEHVAHRLG
jgi:protein-tyrosine phosphatase